MAFSDYFLDPVLRGPVVGTLLMCLGSALIGVLVFLRQRSLLGETLSHAAYPGVIIGAVTAALLGLSDADELSVTLLMMAGGAIFALFGFFCVIYLETKLRVKSDSALCFVLAAFFGIGVTIASQMQFSFTSFYKQIQAYLFGQAATMTDLHIALYGSLTVCVIIAVVLFYKEFQLIAFDKTYAETLGVSVRWAEAVFLVLTVLAIVIGIRSVGVVLMSAMLIAPAAAARQLTNHLGRMLLFAALFGMASAFVGCLLSIHVSSWLISLYPQEKPALPTGPMIVLTASFFCVAALLFSPNRGLVSRSVRAARFRYTRTCENVLKTVWLFNPNGAMPFERIEKYLSKSPLYLSFVLKRLVKARWLTKENGNSYSLTSDGALRAARIVRLHRLWEVYLADYLGVGAERVHRSAEEMEHILTPEIEAELTRLLNDPKRDPHSQPIPGAG